MRRRTFDVLLSSVGVMLTVVLIAAGALLMWGYAFANSNVHSQLAAQKIVFPPKSAFAEAKAGAEITPSMIPTVSQYAGQPLVTGAQAEVYANDFIAVHLAEIGGGKTYAQLSSEAQAQPNNAQLQGQVATLFKGTTLRGLLLNAYAFWKMGQLALIGSIVAFVLAGVMAVLTILGFWHMARATPEQEILAGRPNAA